MSAGEAGPGLIEELLDLVLVRRRDGCAAAVDVVVEAVLRPREGGSATRIAKRGAPFPMRVSCRCECPPVVRRRHRMHRRLASGVSSDPRLVISGPPRLDVFRVGRCWSSSDWKVQTTIFDDAKGSALRPCQDADWCRVALHLDGGTDAEMGPILQFEGQAKDVGAARG